MKKRLFSSWKRERSVMVIAIFLFLILPFFQLNYGARANAQVLDSDRDSIEDAQEYSSGNPGSNNLFPGHAKMLQSMMDTVGSNYVFSTVLIPGSPSNTGDGTLYGWTADNDQTVKYYQEPYLPEEYWKPVNRTSRSDIFSSSVPRVLGIMNYDVDSSTDIHANPMMITTDPTRIGETYYDDRAIFGGWNFIDIYISGISWCEGPFGAISIPTPQEILAAHKNGIPVLSSAFFMPSGPVSWESDLVTKDSQGNLWAIDKMVELANTFHFDGWFFNCETGGVSSDDVSNYENLMEGLKSKGMIVVWYDSLNTSGSISYQNELNSSNEVFLKNSSGFFANYSWGDGNLDTSRNTAGDRPNDVYMGVNAWVEASKSPLSPPGQIPELYNNNSGQKEQKNQLSLGLWAISWPAECGSWGQNPRPTVDELQQRFQTFWWSKQYPNNPNSAQGIGDYVTPKTTITGLPFTTNFNIGKGENYYTNGSITATGRWGNLTEQDILPDYLINNSSIQVGFDFTDAWNGGSCLAISSSGGYSQDVPIYLAAIDDATYTVEVTYKNVGSGSLNFYVKDKDGNKQTVQLSVTGDNWTTAKISGTGSIYEMGVSEVSANSNLKIGAIEISE